MFELVKTIEGKTYNGINYTKKFYETTVERNGRTYTYRQTVTDYTLDGICARVIDHGTRGSLGGDRQNGEMYLVDENGETIGKVRTYAHPENAHGKAIEALMETARK